MYRYIHIVFLLPLLCWAGSSWANDPGSQVVLLAQNEGTEITDLLVPYAMLSKAGMTVEIVATKQGPVNLMSGLELLNLRIIHDIDPSLVDLVIVPAVHHTDQSAMLKWLSSVHGHGATIASICDGVEVLAATGLLDGRRATGHFFSAERRQSNFPDVIWVKDARYVEDGRVFTTAGVSASAPASIRLIERFVDTATAMEVAKHFGVETLGSSDHDSSEFFVGVSEVRIGIRNWLMGLFKKKYTLHAEEKVDEYTLALTVDALTRTYRAAISIDQPGAVLETENGLTVRGNSAYNTGWDIYFDRELARVDSGVKKIIVDDPKSVLNVVFRHISQEFGMGTADFVGMQLEVPERGANLR